MSVDVTKPDALRAEADIRAEARRRGISFADMRAQLEAGRMGGALVVMDERTEIPREAFEAAMRLAPSPRVWSTPSPIRLALPWAVVCPDNRKYVGGRMALTDRYRRSKVAIAGLAREAWPHGPRDGRLAITAVVHAPDRKRRDLANLAKGLHDALEGVLYHDDAQLDDVRYVRGAIDRARPRVELTVSTLTEV